MARELVVPWSMAMMYFSCDMCCPPDKDLEDVSSLHTSIQNKALSCLSTFFNFLKNVRRLCEFHKKDLEEPSLLSE